MSEADSKPPKGSGAKGRESGAPAGSGSFAVADKPSDSNLGAFLSTARERRGVTRDEVVKETRIPANYIAMIESDNYGAISDQLYMLPFIRRYAEFLGLDSEEIGIRFVREVQRAESNVVKMSQPIGDRRQRRGHPGRWALTLLALGIMAAVLYLRNHRLPAFRFQPAATVEPSPAAAAGNKPGLPIAIAPPAVSAPPPTNPAPPKDPSM